MKYKSKSPKQPGFLKKLKHKMPSNIGNIFLKSLIATLVIFLCFIAVSVVFKIRNKTEKLPQDACFLNLNLSKFSRDEVDDFLKKQIQPQIDQLEIKIHFNGQTLSVAASDFDFHYDSNNFFNAAKKTNFKKGESFDPKMDFDKKKLYNHLKDFSQTSKTLPEAYSYRRNGETIIVSAGKDGKIFDVDENYKNIVSMLCQFQDGTIEATYNTIESPNKKINFNEIKSKIDCEAKDASYVKDSNGKTRVEKEQFGLSLDPEEKNKIEDPNEGTYQLNVRIVKPKVTYAGLKANAAHDKNLTDVLASFSTNIEKDKDPNAVFNIRKSARAINGIVLLPGEKFSFKDAITAEKRAHPNEPYREAIQYNTSKPNGQELAEGGGICQTCTTLFGAVLRANLPILQRFCHSKRVKYVPIAQDAAYDYGSKNFEFLNNRQYPIIIKTKSSSNSVEATIFGKDLPSERYVVSLSSKTTSETPTSISGVATQIIKQNGVEIGRRNFYGHYKKYDSENKKKPNNQPAPTADSNTAPIPTSPNASQPTPSQTTPAPLPNNTTAPLSETTQKPNSTQKSDEKTTNSQPAKTIESAPPPTSNSSVTTNQTSTSQSNQTSQTTTSSKPSTKPQTSTTPSQTDKPKTTSSTPTSATSTTTEKPSNSGSTTQPNSQPSATQTAEKPKPAIENNKNQNTLVAVN